jgi:hypothetical protein
MANSVNKSQAIRDYFKANKKAKTSDVIDGLARKGITVTANLVTTVKSKHNKRGRARRKVVAEGGVGIPEVKAALAFLKVAGSVSVAKQALTVAEQIKKIV